MSVALRMLQRRSLPKAGGTDSVPLKIPCAIFFWSFYSNYEVSDE